MNQPSDSYVRDIGIEQSSHNYASLHLAPPGRGYAADLEKGGRYIVKVANQDPINNYAEINDPEQGTHLVPSHGYDVPKPQNKGALQPPSSDMWGPVQSYEKPENIVPGPIYYNSPHSKIQDSKHLSRIEDTSDEYVHPHLLRRANCDAINIPVISSRNVDAVNIPVISSRKVSNESTTSSSTLPLPRERHSSKVVAMSTHGSHGCLQKLPHQQQQNFPSYENVDQDGFAIGQAPPILNPVDGAVATKPKPVPPIKMALKKPAIPSKLFKPTVELKQVQDANSKERKRRIEPITPTGTEKKSTALYDKPKSSRSQTWTLDNKINVNRKLTRASNYTPIDPSKMDPDNDYEPAL